MMIVMIRLQSELVSEFIKRGLPILQAQSLAAEATHIFLSSECATPEAKAAYEALKEDEDDTSIG